MSDKIEKIDSSLVQHGKSNNRIYLMHLSSSDAPHIVPKLESLAEEQGYTKIFAKVPSNAVQYFQNRKFFKEAYVPNFFNGQTGMYCMSKYFDPDRAEIELDDRLEIWKIIQLTKTKEKELDATPPEGITIREIDESEAEQLAQLFRAVFKSYPFPIFETDYIKKSMQDNVRYFGAFDSEKLIGACSAEINAKERNAEMTDFAVLPENRSNNIGLALLLNMEKAIRQLDIKILFTIARALSPGMNMTFAKAGYYFGGTLKNNTQIAGRIESMNVWYKTVQDK